ncbi:MAG: hypothetical protein AAGD00_00215 [Planctomycetota bacterium]
MRTTRTRRGAAMLMVTVALVVATIVGASIVSSRTTSTMIGVNVTRAIEADWASECGAMIISTALSNPSNIDALISGGGNTSAEIGGAQVHVKVTNMQGEPPTADDDTLILITDTVIDGVSSVEFRMITITQQAGLERALDPRLHEFAIVAESVRLDTLCTIATWTPAGHVSTSPARLVGMDSMADLNISTLLTNVFEAELWASAGAGAAVRDAADGNTAIPYRSGGVLPLDVPRFRHRFNPSPFNALPHWPDPGTTGEHSEQSFNGTTIDEDLPRGEFGSIEVRGNAKLTLHESVGPLFSCDSLLVDNAELHIEGHVTLNVWDDVEITNRGGIFFADDSSLTLHVGGELVVNGGLIGAPIEYRSMNPVDWITAHGSATSSSADRITILSGYDDSTPNEWVISGMALTGGDIRTNADTVRVTGASVHSGRISAPVVEITAASMFLYDTTFAEGSAYSDLDGIIYHDPDTDGVYEPLPGIGTAIGTYHSQGWYDETWVDAAVALVEAETGEPAPTGGTPTINIYGESFDMLVQETKIDAMRNTDPTDDDLTDEEYLDMVMQDVLGMSPRTTDVTMEGDDGLQATIP